MRKLRISLVHVPYETKGGEDVHVDSLDQIYGDLGHEVYRWKTPREKSLRVGIEGILGSSWIVSHWEQQLKQAQPDLFHLHNVHPGLGPSFLAWLRTKKVPVWMTAHNHRFYCTNGLALRNGAICKQCIRTNWYWRPLAMNCNESITKTAYYSLALSRIRSQNLWQTAVSLWIAPSPYMKEELIAAGVAPGKVDVLAHSVDANERESSSELGADVLYVGRFSQEKGAKSLPKLAALLPNRQFVFVGHGPLEREIRSQSQGLPNVRVYSDLNRGSVLDLIAKSKVGIVPSLCNEALSLFALECLYFGRRIVVPKLPSTSWLTQEPFQGTAADTSDLNSMAKACEEALALPARTESDSSQLKTLLGQENYKKRLSELLAKLKSG